MTTLHNILQQSLQTSHATATGAHTHRLLQHIFIDTDNTTGEPILVEKIRQNPNIARLFCSASKTEVPVAGTINNRFISRRIDRLLIDDSTKTISILDYKTDINHDTFYKQYVYQIQEYTQLLHQIYPEHNIVGYILWTHDFTLERVV